VFPALSLLAAQGDTAGVRAKLDTIVHGTMLLSVPAAAGMWAVSEDLVTVAFVHGQYTAKDAKITASTTGWLVAGLPFLSAAQLYARALYALGDNRTPAVASVVLLFVTTALNLLCVLVFGLGPEGLTLASSVGNLLNALWLRARLRMLLPPGAPAGGRILRIAAATLGMVLAVSSTRSLVAAETRLGRSLWHLALPIAAGMAVYAVLHVASGGRELKDLWRRRARR
jgi:putative peptidoglycan lipid II flippase